MSDSDAVTMNIPDNHPLFDWVWECAYDINNHPVPYIELRAGEISARLSLASVDGIHQDNTYRYLETSWRLLRDNT